MPTCLAESHNNLFVDRMNGETHAFISINKSHTFGKRGIFSAVFSMLCVYEKLLLLLLLFSLLLFFFFFFFVCLACCFSTFCLLLYHYLGGKMRFYIQNTECRFHANSGCYRPLHRESTHTHTRKILHTGHGCEFIRTLSHGIACLQRSYVPRKWHKQIIYFCWLYYKLRRVTLQHVSVCCCVLISVCFLIITYRIVCIIYIYIYLYMYSSIDLVLFWN